MSFSDIRFNFRTLFTYVGRLFHFNDSDSEVSLAVFSEAV